MSHIPEAVSTQMVEIGVLIQYKRGFYTIIAISPGIEAGLKVGDRVEPKISLEGDNSSFARIKILGTIYAIVPYWILRRVS